MATKTKQKPNTTLDVEVQPEASKGEVATTVAQFPAGIAPEAAAFLSMIERASRDPAVDVAKMEKLLELRNQQRDYDARVEFDNAMADAQAEMEPVRKNSQGDKSKYASYGALDNAIRDIYTKHGFAISYNTIESQLPEHVKVLARCSHRAGHRENYHIDMPADGKGARGNDVMTKTHATGSAYTYGRRYLLGGIFNVAITDDDDGKAAGYKPSAGSAGAGPDFRGHSSANGRRMAQDDRHLQSDRSKGEVPPAAFDPPADPQKWAEWAIQTLNGEGHTEDTVRGFAKDNGKTLAWMKDKQFTLYERVSTAYGNALQAVRGKTAPKPDPKPAVTDVADQNDLPPEHARPGHPLHFTPYEKNSDFMNFAEDFLPKTNAPGANQFLAYYEGKISRMEASKNADVQEAASWCRATIAEIVNPPDSKQ